jgi:polyketide synthase Type III
MGVQAIDACLKDAAADVSDIAHLCCVTSTGFLTPGLTALLIRDMGIAPHCGRVDVVGMGCNAGLNALGVMAAWSAAHSGQLAFRRSTASGVREPYHHRRARGHAL